MSSEPDAIPGPPRPHPHVGLLAAVVAAVTTLDQAAKAWVRDRLALLERVEVVPGLLDLVHVQNRGLAWGLLAGHPLRLPLVTFASLATFVVMLGWYRRLEGEDRAVAWCLALVLAGATGNFVDRLLYRAVTDFLELSAPGPLGDLARSTLGSDSWAVFNLADVAISAGLLAFLGLVARGRVRVPETLR